MIWNGVEIQYSVFTDEVEWYSAEELNDFNNTFITMQERKYKELRMALDDDDKLASEATIKGKKIVPPDGYLIGKITQVDNGMLIEYVEKKPVYPTTYAECHELMVKWKEYDCNPNSELIFCDAPIHDFCKIIVARNLYWKIAGEQMGLGKPWEPNWEDDTAKYNIFAYKNHISFDVSIHANKILVFPTKEIRDIFYKNFKELIERCKEML